VKIAAQKIRRKLNHRHEAYILARVAGKMGAVAAREAGFGERRARQTAYELEQDPAIRARIAELRAEKLRALHMDADEILARAAMIARSDPRALFDEKGNLRPLSELSDQEAAAIAGIESSEEFDGKGKDRVKVGDVRKVRLRDPMPALRLLAEHKKLVKSPEEGLNALAGAIADRLKAARERRRTQESKP
jgi:phage terminase small subunit